ncbi:hypothetical protein H312_01504 [Anncaliia algerae PRA339]|uniref:Uncharacterized protein n=1 Tax=Anncaliia algerae PRA339 TaxID=1288291 RepID=A0A059F1Q3_9MICR|nr:hypothetical protein H312_01504 [Anncaliia algerae PRA339]
MEYENYDVYKNIEKLKFFNSIKPKHLRLNAINNFIVRSLVISIMTIGLISNLFFLFVDICIGNDVKFGFMYGFLMINIFKAYLIIQKKRIRLAYLFYIIEYLVFLIYFIYFFPYYIFTPKNFIVFTSAIFISLFLTFLLQTISNSFFIKDQRIALVLICSLIYFINILILVALVGKSTYLIIFSICHILFSIPFLFIQKKYKYIYIYSDYFLSLFLIFFAQSTLSILESSQENILSCKS